MDQPIETLLQLPAGNTAEKAKPQKNIWQKAAFVFCIMLTMLSVAAHLGLSAAFFDFASDGEAMQEMLLSSVLPRFTSEEAFSEEEKTDIQSIQSTVTESDTDTDDKQAEEKDSISQNLSASGEKGFSLKNETTYNPDLEVLYNSPDPIDKADKLYERFMEDEPLVLIYHTHGTESYNDTNDTGTFRSNDPSRNMIAVGVSLKNVLEANGIKTIHLTKMFDEKSYNTAYNKSAEAVEKVLREYPSIQYILDVHRDSITDENGNCISADFTFGEKTAAQLMFVVGTDEGGSGHTEWRQNLTAVLHLQEMLVYSAPSSVRPINLRKASFYQDKGPGAMLVEIGTCGNTLAEAKRSAIIFADTLSEYILGKEPPKSIDELMKE